MYKKARIYLISNILTSAIPFILLPVLTRSLSVEEYGQIAMFQTLLAGFSAVIGFNGNVSVERFFYDKHSDNVLREYNDSCFYVLLFSFVVVMLGCYIFDSTLSSFLSIPISWIYLTVVISFLNFIVVFRLGQFQIRKEAFYFGIIQVTGALFNVLLSILFVVFLKYGPKGRIDAIIISSFFMAIISIISLYKDDLVGVFRVSFFKIKEVLKLGLPLIPHTLGIFLLTAVDRFIINNKLGLDSAGIYMVAVQLSMTLSMIFDAVNKAIVPWLFEELNNKSTNKYLIVKYTYMYFLVLFFISIFIFFVGDYFVVLIVGVKYKIAGEIIGWLCLGQIFSGMYLMVTNYLFYAKKTGKLAMVTIFSGGCNIIFLIIFINYLGLIGAAYAFAFSMFIRFILTWIISSIYIDMPWFKFKDIVKKR
ncbi:lipopolysaccharide biosynthesis protein [Photobacterium leiognathi]|uniref:lipopolysaccharide biosynthesis protein n=1 Tax=Photobacterium leiognathi TaxID=553611 RepID=UPI002981D5D1|nr:oligosaccharide flippase family protein [Photobacterium leiognathi]